MKIDDKVKIIKPELQGTKAAEQVFMIHAKIGEKFHIVGESGFGWAIVERKEIEKMISYKMFLVEDDSQLQVPMTPTAKKLTGCHTYFWPKTDWGWAEAKKKAKEYAAYARRIKSKHGDDWEDYL